MHKITLLKLGGVVLKGKIIDYDFFEAFILLEDDSVVKVPVSQVTNSLTIGALVSFDANDLNVNTGNNSRVISNGMDFF